MGGLFLLCRGECRGSAHLVPSRFGAAPAFGGTRADKVALHVRQAAENGQHQAASAGAGVGPRLSERTKLRLGVHDLLDDSEQVEGAAGQPGSWKAPTAAAHLDDAAELDQHPLASGLDDPTVMRRSSGREAHGAAL